MPVTAQAIGHYDSILSQFSHAYMQDAAGFVADKVFPVVNVEHASDIYWTYPRGNFFRDDVAKRPMGGRVPVTGFGASTATYNVEEEGLGALIDDRERANQSNGFDVDRNKTVLLTSQHAIHRDRAFVSAFFNPSAGWGRTVTGVASAPSNVQCLKWNLTTADPIAIVRAEALSMKTRTGIRPNKLILGSNALEALVGNPTIIDRIKYTQLGFVDLDLLAKALKLDQVVVADAVYNSAAEGATESLGFIAGQNDALLVYAAPNPGLMQPSAGYIIAWNGLLPGGGLTARVDRYRMELEHSDLLEVRMAYTMKMVAPDLGTYFSAVGA